MSKYLVTTENGTKYEIDLDKGFWKRGPHEGSQSPNLAFGHERLWSFKLGVTKTRPWESPDDWEDATEPKLGKHLFVSSRDVWYVSMPIIKIVEVDG